MTGKRASPFSRGAVLGMVVIGFIAFVAMLYFLSVGDTGGDENNGGGHAAANGLNGYSGLARLLDAEGYDVIRSREESGLDTNGLLVLTPPSFFDAEDLSRIIRDRAYVGPTMVIVPKWLAFQIPPMLEAQVEEEIEKGWVLMSGTDTPDWLAELEEPFNLETKINDTKNPVWAAYRSDRKSVV